MNEDEKEISFEVMDTGNPDAVMAEFSGMLEKSSRQRLKEVALSFGGDIVEPVIPVFDLAHLVLNSTWHARCVEIKSTAATSPGWEIESDEGDGDRAEDVAKYLDLAARNDDTCDLSALMNALAIDLCSLGTAYIEIVRDAAGRPVEFYHVPALTVRRRQIGGYWQLANLSRNMGETAFTSETLPRQAKQTFQLFGGAVYSQVYFKEFGDEREFDIDGNLRMEIPVESMRATELIQVKQYHPLSPLYGIPSFISSFSAMVSDEAAEKWNLSFFENNRVPRWLFKITGGTMKPEEKEEFKTYFSQILKGRAHSPMLLLMRGENSRIEVEKLEADVNEGSFLDLRRMNRDEIIASHGVPPRLLGIVTPGSLGGSGEAQTQREDFRDFAVAPLQVLLVDWLNYRILPAAGMSGYRIVPKQFDIQSADELKKKVEAVKALFEVGTVSANEARRLLGLPQISEKWAEKHFLVSGERLVEISDESLKEREEEENTGREVDRSLSRIRRETLAGIPGRPEQGKRKDAK